MYILLHFRVLIKVNIYFIYSKAILLLKLFVCLLFVYWYTSIIVSNAMRILLIYLLLTLFTLFITYETPSHKNKIMNAKIVFLIFKNMHNYIYFENKNKTLY